MTANRVPATGRPTTGRPTAGVPTAGVPTAGVPTTGVPTTGVSATGESADGATGEGTTGDGPRIRLATRVENGTALPVLVWAAGPGWRMISSGVVGGGIGERSWWLNASVARDYARTDLPVHLAEIAAPLGLSGTGVGMLTAADVRARSRAQDGGVHVVATVGLGVPVPAAVPQERGAAEVAAPAGTINVLAVLPVPLSDAALVNAVLTLTEAKTQALVEHAVPGTGTASDAVCIACPVSVPGSCDPAVPFAGPRSLWGARLARAVHRAIGEGTAGWLARHPAGDVHRRWPAR